MRLYLTLDRFSDWSVVIEFLEKLKKLLEFLLLLGLNRPTYWIDRLENRHQVGNGPRWEHDGQKKDDAVQSSLLVGHREVVAHPHSQNGWGHEVSDCDQSVSLSLLFKFESLKEGLHILVVNSFFFNGHEDYPNDSQNKADKDNIDNQLDQPEDLSAQEVQFNVECVHGILLKLLLVWICLLDPVLLRQEELVVPDRRVDDLRSPSCSDQLEQVDESRVGEWLDVFADNRVKGDECNQIERKLSSKIHTWNDLEARVRLSVKSFLSDKVEYNFDKEESLVHIE